VVDGSWLLLIASYWREADSASRVADGRFWPDREVTCAARSLHGTAPASLMAAGDGGSSTPRICRTARRVGLPPRLRANITAPPAVRV